MRATVAGLECSYTDEGEGFPLVFLHGFPLSRAAWSKQVEAFRERYRVLAPDLRGLGESGSTPGPVAMSRFAADVEALLGQLKTGPVILVGHSMGGYVALAFAKAFPQALRGLVLVGTKAGPDTPEAAAARRATAEQVRAQGVSGVVDAMAPKMLSAANPDPAMAAEVREIMASARPKGVIGALLGMAERPDARPWLEGIRTPTLVVAGTDDAIVPPAEAQALAKGIPGARLALVTRGGHLVAYEQAEAFNTVLQGWLQDLGV